jgi:hypothetical protein
MKANTSSIGNVVSICSCSLVILGSDLRVRS